MQTLTDCLRKCIVELEWDKWFFQLPEKQFESTCEHIDVIVRQIVIIWLVNKQPEFLYLSQVSTDSVQAIEIQT